MADTSGGQSRYVILAAMIFAVAMTFIDQTIVSIAVPKIQSELALSSTGVQWVVNGYLLSLAALFALGGRLADTMGHRTMVIVGVVVFAFASAMCGLTPKGSYAEAWIVGFRVLQGAGGAIMYPAALGIVVNTFPLRERGKALALFFGVAGGLTAVGPILGGYLTEWTWRAIFWVNIPVAVIALVLIIVSKPTTLHRRARIDIRGAVLIAAGVALSIFGLQQSAIWGWSNSGTWLCIIGGLVLLVVFTVVETRTTPPLMQVSIFRVRAFFVENVVLFVSMMAFVPVFFFASEYAQISLGESASETGLYLLIFFAGFATATQWGGKMLDRIGARRPVVMGCAIGAIGFYLWGKSMTHLSVNEQWYYIVIAGIGVGLVLSPANTDALNRVARERYGEATGITQTVRNFGASVGLAILGSLLITWNKSNLESILGAKGVPKGKADAVAECVSQGETACRSVSQALGSKAGEVFSAVPMAFAEATRDVFYGMAIALAIAFVIAVKFMPSGKVEEGDVVEDSPSPGTA
jgi:EmrB/QacA subfamily drug resistance transporter